MKKMILVVLFLITLVGCSKKENTNKNIDANYNLDAYELNVNDNLSDEDAGIYVAGKSMQATVEITCTINFSCLVQTIWGTQTQTNTTKSSGTGFFINEDGYLLTNAHVVESGYEAYSNYTVNSRTIQINYAESDVLIDAYIVEKNSDLDLAILKTTSTIDNVKYLAFYNITDPTSEEYNQDNAVKLLYGESVYVVGNAYGYGISITKGVCSATVRYFKGTNNKVTQAIQTDSAINSGNSGGPLLNKYCYVIGINSFKLVTDGVEGLGFAIPSNVAIDYILSLEERINYYYTNMRGYNAQVLSRF